MCLADLRTSMSCRLLRAAFNTVCVSVGDMMLKCLMCSETKFGALPLKQGQEVIKSLTYQFLHPPYMQNVRPPICKRCE